MGLLTVGTVMIVLGLIIDYAKNVSTDNRQIWSLMAVFFIFGVVIEQIAIYCLDYDAVKMIGQWIVDIWIFGMPVESLYLYIAFPYLALIIYYGFVKGMK